MSGSREEPGIRCTTCLTRYSLELIRCPDCERLTALNRADWLERSRPGPPPRHRPSVVFEEVGAWLLVLIAAALIWWLTLG